MPEAPLGEDTPRVAFKRSRPLDLKKELLSRWSLGPGRQGDLPFTWEACLSASLHIQPCPGSKPALIWCVRLDNGTKLPSSLNPHPLQGDCVLLDFGFGQ